MYCWWLVLWSLLIGLLYGNLFFLVLCWVIDFKENDGKLVKVNFLYKFK